MRIDGGEPVLEEHQLAVASWWTAAGDEGGLEVTCTGCGAELELPSWGPPLTTGDLIWLAIEHRGQLAAEEAP